MSTPFGVIDNTLASPQGYPPVHEAYGYNGEILGQGAYGVVLMATHKISGAKHALKFVDKSCTVLERDPNTNGLWFNDLCLVAGSCCDA